MGSLKGAAFKGEGSKRRPKGVTDGQRPTQEGSQRQKENDDRKGTLKDRGNLTRPHIPVF